MPVWVGRGLLNFQRIQKVHTLLQHITLSQSVLGMVHTVLIQFSLPFHTSLFSFFLSNFFCCTICRFFFLLLFLFSYNTLYRKKNSWVSHKLVNYIKQKIVAWRVATFTTKPQFYFKFSLHFVEEGKRGQIFFFLIIKVKSLDNTEMAHRLGVFFLAVSGCPVP